ncbi:MAG: hypothetical protein HQK54_01455 [Oligoflexales bacterium]|nr:hypothetical protein [Oligoflexales bacterium]
MSFKTFINESGLKVLAMARLNQCEYGIMLYLLNCSASGLTELITTKKELFSLIGYEEDQLNEGLLSLEQKKFINIRYGEKHIHPSRQSLRIGIQYDISVWEFDTAVDLHTADDAVVFPFVKGKNLQLIADSGEKAGKNSATIKKALPTWKRIINSFAEGRSLTKREMDKALQEAKMIVQTHPVDQVLLLLRHFGKRIPTISLLASSWHHYQDLFEEETQKVDLLGARQKHVEQDMRLREEVEVFLKNRKELELTEEEVGVLEIIFNHSHPRRQLFWAYQTRGRYPNLKSFFTDNSKIMLPVTSKGTVIKKKPHQDS